VRHAQQRVVLYKGVEPIDGHGSIKRLEGLLEDPQVHAANDLALFFGEVREWTTSEEDAAVIGYGRKAQIVHDRGDGIDGDLGRDRTRWEVGSVDRGSPPAPGQLGLACGVG
jgi:hypothetical protein